MTGRMSWNNRNQGAKQGLDASPALDETHRTFYNRKVNGTQRANRNVF